MSLAADFISILDKKSICLFYKTTTLYPLDISTSSYNHSRHNLLSMVSDRDSPSCHECDVSKAPTQGKAIKEVARSIVDVDDNSYKLDLQSDSKCNNFLIEQFPYMNQMAAKRRYHNVV